MVQDVSQWLAVDNPNCNWSDDSSADDFGGGVFRDPEEGKERNQDEYINNLVPC